MISRLIAWVIKNRQVVIQAGWLAYEYGPKAYKLIQDKIKKLRYGKIRNQRTEGEFDDTGATGDSN